MVGHLEMFLVETIVATSYDPNLGIIINSLFSLSPTLQISVFLAQSEILGLLTDYFSLEDPTPAETNAAYLFAAILSILALCLILVNLLYFVGRKIGGLIRIVLTLAIYSKVSRQSDGYKFISTIRC